MCYISYMGHSWVFSQTRRLLVFAAVACALLTESSSLYANEPPIIEGTIQFDLGTVQALSTSDVCMPLSIRNRTDSSHRAELSSFELLLTYDSLRLSFTGIDLTESVLQSAMWESLTYRIVSTDPPLILISAVADIDDPASHPADYGIDGLVVNVCFRTTNDRRYSCVPASVQFYWRDCDDNIAYDRDGNVLSVVTSDGIVDRTLCDTISIDTFEGGITGPSDFPCSDLTSSGGKVQRELVFVNAPVQILCPGVTHDDFVGDINLNGLPYEIADVRLLADALLYGSSVFAIHEVAQTASTDVNLDGNALTVSDLVYMMRVISGDVFPWGICFSPVTRIAGAMDIRLRLQDSTAQVVTRSDVDQGAVLYVLNYDNTLITDVSLVTSVAGMDLRWNAEDGDLRILVLQTIEPYYVDGSRIPPGLGATVQIDFEPGGLLSIVSIEAATYDANLITSRIGTGPLPSEFQLGHNYPNPFNPETSFDLSFPYPSDYDLTIYNVLGRRVRTFAGFHTTGVLTLNWNGLDSGGREAPSGVYFYRLNAGPYSEAKKMVLMR